jgi:hypothetical protein
MTRAARALALAIASLASAACNDATHDMQVQALGGEDPAVPVGELHRPGQPCLVCHGGIGPASSHFTAGGTVYVSRGSTVPAAGATVLIEDITGSVGTAQSNEVGNFYIPVAAWQPTFPTLPQVTYNGLTQPMTTHVGRDGSCASCHTDPAGPTAAGHLYIYLAGPDGGP